MLTVAAGAGTVPDAGGDARGVRRGGAAVARDVPALLHGRPPLRPAAARRLRLRRRRLRRRGPLAGQPGAHERRRAGRGGGGRAAGAGGGGGDGAGCFPRVGGACGRDVRGVGSGSQALRGDSVVRAPLTSYARYAASPAAGAEGMTYWRPRNAVFQRG